MMPTDINRIANSIQQFADVSWITESYQEATRFAERMDAMVTNLRSPFEKLLIDDRLTTYFPQIAHIEDSFGQFEAGLKRHSESHLLVSAALPKRGWYLSGSEPCTLSLSLAKSVREQNWDKVDQEVMEHVPEYKLDLLPKWLSEQGVPEYCSNRLCLFLRHHRDGHYEEATYLGVPLIDEVAMLLYNGKSFTTKRGKPKTGTQSKPELAVKTASGPEITNYCNAFLQTFGSLQEDPDQQRLADPDYWNRHAIVHGMMRRAMGQKDSAKCVMAISFLLHARKDAPEEGSSD